MEHVVHHKLVQVGLQFSALSGLGACEGFWGGVLKYLQVFFNLYSLSSEVTVLVSKGNDLGVSEPVFEVLY